MPTRTLVRGTGPMAVTAQATNENELKVTAIEIRPTDDQPAAPLIPKGRRLPRQAPRRLPTSSGWAPVASLSLSLRHGRSPESSYDAFAVVAVRMSALRLRAAIRPSMPSFFRIAPNSERRVATSLIALSR